MPTAKGGTEPSHIFQIVLTWFGALLLVKQYPESGFYEVVVFIIYYALACLVNDNKY